MTRHRASNDSASALMIFNKPFNVLCQFTDSESRATLADFIDQPGFYAAGRLDRDSEGLLILTNDGKLQHRISHPGHKLEKRYLAQLEGTITDAALATLNSGLTLKDGPAKATFAQRANPPAYLWTRDPPIRFRANLPTSWIEIGLTEGRNRQVRRMTAATGFPTLRLIRTHIGKIDVWQLAPGIYRIFNTRVIDQKILQIRQ